MTLTASTERFQILQREHFNLPLLPVALLPFRMTSVRFRFRRPKLVLGPSFPLPEYAAEV